MPNVRWENNILGFIPQTDWLSVPFQITRPNDPADQVFGDLKTENLVAEWESIASEYQIPVMAQFHGFDTESQTTFRVPIDTHNIEKGLIKVKINQSERMRTLLRSGVQGDSAMYDYVINDGVRLAEQVVTRTKVAKNELLATGKVTIKENNLDLTVDYGVPAKHTNLVLDFSEDADIPAQLQEIIQNAADEGVILTGIFTSRENIGKMRRNKALQIAIGGIYAQGALIRQTELTNYLAEEFGISRVITNDLTYGESAEIIGDRPAVKTARYYPKNKVTFFATKGGNVIGTGLWGDSPEADAAKFMDVSGSGVSPYVWISQWMEKDPAVLWTKASSLFMPVLYDPNSLFIASVADDFMDTATISPVGQSTDFWGTLASEIQSADTTVSNGVVTGTLTKLTDTSKALVRDWGAGYFLGLKWDDIDPSATSLKVGLEPSAGSGLIEAIGDPDKNGVFKITNKNIQKFKLVVSNNTHSRVQTLDLSHLVLS